MCNKFRELTAGEIECRVAQTGKSGERVWCSILIYKDARVDQKLLDEVVGPMNWKNEYSLIDGKIFSTVSIWDEEKKEWISKQNVGVESNTEKEKGQASDAFKRACFNWGIGRELYTAPRIYFDLMDGEYSINSDNRVRCRAEFFVRDIGYDTERVINKLTIIDRNGRVRYDMNANGVSFEQPASTSTRPVQAIITYTSADGKTMYEGGNVWKKAAKRAAAGEVAEDGTPIAVKMQEYYNIPADAMSRFFDLVNKIKSSNPEYVAPSQNNVIHN